ncbi:MAG: peptidase M48 [Verrucomicrobia bacterium]|nr:peptidase M48 [Verrucomicrobiota bacterium]
MKKIIIVLSIIGLFAHCAKVPITGRKQLKLFPSSQMSSMSFDQYDQVKKEGNILPDDDKRVELVRKVGNKISASVNKYLTENGEKKRVEEFEWEINVIDENIVNAWAMPGGKIMFYTGILPICDGEEGIATVMGHEIAHAVARHGNERMSQQIPVQLGSMGLAMALEQKPEMTKNILMSAVGAGSQLGILKYSRMHESEADKMGLVFMTMAGYNPEAAIDFWKRMSENKGGGAPPEFMSTHPSDERRISDIKAFIPEARKYAP